MPEPDFTNLVPQPACWRIIKHAPAPGRWNMAVDEALLTTVGTGRSEPVLRLYGWEPGCLSLGIAQPSSDIDFPRLQANGWEWVRRPTGGRAILHIDELTYSITAPLNDPHVAGSVLESYLRISRALLHALEILGLDAIANDHHQNQEGRNRSTGPVCFEIPSSYEITIGGKKLIGSAQARRREGVLQHGSLPLHGDLTRITRALVYHSEQERVFSSQRLMDHAVTLENALGKRISWDEAAGAFARSFTETLRVDLIPSELSAEETALAEKIFAEKYASSGWNSRL